MNKKLIERQVQAELEHYFEYARAQKCPPGMKRKLYHQLEINSQNSKATSWFPARLTLAGLSLVFVSSVVLLEQTPLAVPGSSPEHLEWLEPASEVGLPSILTVEEPSASLVTWLTTK